MFVQAQEAWRGQPALNVPVARPRVGKRNPDFIQLAGTELSSQVFGPHADETHVSEAQLGGTTAASPNALAFDIESQKVAVGMALGQAHGVFTFPTAYFQRQRVRGQEEISAPATTKLLVFGLARFNNIGADGVVSKTLKFDAGQIEKVEK